MFTREQKIRDLIQQEICERQEAADSWDTVLTWLGCESALGKKHAEGAQAKAFAAQNRAEVHRLERLALELEQ